MHPFPRIAIHELVITPEYEVHLDEHSRGEDTFLLVHVRVLKWAPSTLKSLLRNLRILRACVAAPLFALGEVDDAKYERFVSLCGFTFLQMVICENGESRRLFINRHRKITPQICPPTPSPPKNPPPT